MKVIISILMMLMSTVCLQAQKILLTKPRLMYNYTLFIDSVFNIDYTKLPEGARPQLTNDLKAVAKQQLIQFESREDKVDRFWYINNTCFKQCKMVIIQNNKMVSEIIFWPNAEYVEVDTKRLINSSYKLQIFDGDVLKEDKLIVRD